MTRFFFIFISLLASLVMWQMWEHTSSSTSVRRVEHLCSRWSVQFTCAKSNYSKTNLKRKKAMNVFFFLSQQQECWMQNKVTKWVKMSEFVFSSLKLFFFCCEHHILKCNETKSVSSITELIIFLASSLCEHTGCTWNKQHLNAKYVKSFILQKKIMVDST